MAVLRKGWETGLWQRQLQEVYLDYMPYPSRNKAEKACFDHGCQGLAKKGWLTRAYYPADPRRKSPNGRWVLRVWLDGY